MKEKTVTPRPQHMAKYGNIPLFVSKRGILIKRN